MYRPRIIPVLLLQGRALVKTLKFKNPVYLGDPINAVKIFNDMDADELIFLDIYASKNIDFEDALSFAHMEKRQIKEIYSYDSDFDKLEELRRLEP